MTLSRVTTLTGLTPGNQRRHRHAGAAHSEWRVVKQPVGPTGGLCAGPLAASPDDECAGVAVRGGVAANHGGQALERVESAATLIWKLLQVVEQTFRRLKAPELLPAVYAGAQYVDGVQNRRAARQEVAA